MFTITQQTQPPNHKGENAAAAQNLFIHYKCRSGNPVWLLWSTWHAGPVVAYRGRHQQQYRALWGGDAFHPHR